LTFASRFRGQVGSECQIRSTSDRWNSLDTTISIDIQHSANLATLMKAAPFAYFRPTDLDDACAILASDEDARIIAGGQSLVPMMAMRLVRPTKLVDIARIPALSYVRQQGDVVAIGATTRQCVVEHDRLIQADVPLLSKVLPWIGHAATRARGTIGGSMAHADPAAEIPLVAITLGATVLYNVAGASKEIPASDFFTGIMATALPLASCLTAVHFPRANGARIGVGFREINARRSDFAFAAAAAQVVLNEDDTCRDLLIGIGAITPVPFRLDDTASRVIGSTVEETAVRAAVEDELAETTPMSDLHASASYRRRVAGSLAVRAVMEAVASARAETRHVH
jgi:2-furoyl-CoA dehydrogenase FAD binding subunit